MAPSANQLKISASNVVDARAVDALLSGDVSSAPGGDALNLGLTLPETKRAADLSLPRPEPRINAAWLIVPCLLCDFLMAPVFSLINGPPGAWWVVVGLGI